MDKGLRKGGIARFLLFFLLFSLVPVAIAAFLGLYSLSLEEGFRRQGSADTLEADLSGIVRRIDPFNYLESRFRQFSRQLFSKPLAENRIRNLSRNARRLWGVEFDPYVFSEQGKLITPESVPLKTRFAMQKVWDILRKTPRWKPKDYQTNKKLINSWLGSDFLFSYLKDRRGKVLTTRSPGSDAAVFWEKSPGTQFGGVLLIAWKIPTHSGVLRQFAGRPPLRGISLYSLTDTAAWKCLWKTHSTDPEGLPGLADFSRGANRLFRGRMTWLYTGAGDAKLLAGRAESYGDLTFLSATIKAVSLCICVFLAIFWFRRLVLGYDIHVPIRTKLILLFIFSLLIPLMGVAFLGFRMLRDREEVLVTERLAEAREALNDLDKEFVGEMDRYLAFFRKFRDDPDRNDNPRRLRERAVKARERFLLLRFETRDLDGKIILSTDDDQSVEGLLAGFESMAKMSIERYLPERVRTMAVKPKQKFDMATSMILQSREMGLTTFMDRPDQVHPLRFGTNDIFWYWDVFRDPKYPAAFVTLAQSRRHASQWFLKRRLKQRWALFKIVACWQEMDTWYPLGSEPTAALRNMADQIRITHQPVIGRITLKTRKYHAMGIPGNNIKNYALMALFPETDIRRQIVNMRWGIILGILTAILVAMVTGFALSDTFLRPIGELDEGMAALSRREMAYRVPVSSRDELGELTQTFNYMMGELKEMAMARIVQESLFPREMPKIPGYAVDILNIPASDLGGDYCDALPMTNGRLLFAIGDVTGHGASSALLMAMSKAITFEFSESEKPLTRLMDDLNLVIFKVLQRKKMMTFFAAILEPETNQLMFSLAGHPYPFHCRADGTVTQLAMVHLPLGMSPDSPRSKFVQAAATLEQGDFILLFTDGLVEAMSPAGEAFGYERLEAFLPALRHLPAGMIKQAVADEFFRYRDSSEALEDDFTIGVLKRDT